MKTVKHIFLIAALFLAVGSYSAVAGPKNANSQRKKNAQYEKTIDSLRREVTRLTEELQLRGGLGSDIIEIIDENDRRGRAYDAELTDSLLSIWYLQQSLAEEAEPDYQMDSVRFTSNVPDSVYIKRIEDMNLFITLPYNDIVRNYIILYSEKMPKRIGKIIGLCNYYMPIFDEIFNQYNLPEELMAMAVIESALNPTATSRAGAKGMWQFMYKTAKLYGLDIDSFVDERMDPIASAHAAAQYLRDSYDMFGDWSLTIASYNCGAGNVSRAIRRSGGKTNFWDIYPYLPRETRGYVPAFVGALYTMYYYREHGIVPEATGLAPVVDTLMINKKLHFQQVNELVGVPMEELRSLNPQYFHDIVPGTADREYILRIPYSYVNAFISVEDSLYNYKADEYFSAVNMRKIQDGVTVSGDRMVYKVRSGDTLSRIASRYGTTVAKLKQWNNLSSNNIRIGQNLVIYSNGAAPASSSSTASSSSSSGSGSSASAAAPIDPNADYTIYTVQSGDSLYSIAKKYPGVSAQNIMDFNGISSSKIKPGLKLKIPKVK